MNCDRECEKEQRESMSTQCLMHRNPTQVSVSQWSIFVEVIMREDEYRRIFGTHQYQQADRTPPAFVRLLWASRDSLDTSLEKRARNTGGLDETRADEIYRESER